MSIRSTNAPAPVRRAALRGRSGALSILVASCALLLALADAASVSAAPARSARVATGAEASGDLVVTGARTARRRDQFILYLARRCVSTLGAARRGHYVIASGRVDRSGRERFRAVIAESEVTPRRGRACYLIADSRRRTRVRVSAAYEMR